MADSEKPFACSSPGCNMSFTNEDHLVVHEKKHDMTLNLGAGGKNGTFVADQTPTPTRFIRNCEEVGLFQDLQNVNPFEETFRRAVESGKIGALPESELSTNDDTLHTPLVFPHIEHGRTSCNRIDNTVDIMPDTLGNKTVTNVIEHNITEGDNNKKSIKKITETIVIQEADTSIIPPVLHSTPSFSLNGEEVQLLLKTEDGSMVQLSAIPVCNFSNNNIPCDNNSSNNQSQQSKSQTIVLKTALTLKKSETTQIKNSPSFSLAKTRLRQALVKNNTKRNNDRVTSNSINIKEELMTSVIKKDEKYDNILRKQEILERNRASSMRARAKRKEWIQQLEKSVKNVNATNATLQMEIKSLQTEVTKLKTILLAHQDCPITKAIEEGNSVITKSKIIPIQASQYLQSMSTPSSNCTIHGIKRNLLINDIPIVAKRQPLILPTATKQSILLPKTLDKSMPILTKLCQKNSDTTAKKLIDLNISNNKQTEPNKSILIIQNGSNGGESKIQVINPQEIVNIDQSLQLINVASKTTGT